MKTLNQITDPVYTYRENYNGYEAFWLKYMRDKRDLPFIQLLTIIHLTVLPVFILLFTKQISNSINYSYRYEFKKIS